MVLRTTFLKAAGHISKYLRQKLDTLALLLDMLALLHQLMRRELHWIALRPCQKPMFLVS